MLLMGKPSINGPFSIAMLVITVNLSMENHHAINGKTHYFYDHFQ